MAELDNRLKIGILGPGAVGSLIAALYWRAGYPVTCIGTNRAVDSIRLRGIDISSSVYGHFVAFPDAEQSLTEPVDVLFVTVKSPNLVEALSRIRYQLCEKMAVVSLLNGIGHRETIRRMLGPHVAVGTIGAVEVVQEENRLISHRSPMLPHIDIASEEDVAQDLLQSIAFSIGDAGISVSIRDSENEVIWKKLVRLCAIATLTTFSQSPVGQVRYDSILRRMLETIIKELVGVAAAEGVMICASEVLSQIDHLPEGMTTSMQRDICSRAPSELNAIVGGVLGLGKKHGLSIPCLESAYSSIQTQLCN